MTNAEGVVVTFSAARKSGQTTRLSDACHALAAPGENFVRVSLMANIPDQPIMGRVEHVMQCNRKLNRAEASRQMATRFADGLNQKTTEFIRQFRQLVDRQPTQICRRVDGVEEWEVLTLGHSLLKNI